LVALALVFALLQQPAVSATVDRTEAFVGEVLTLTIRVEAAGPDPVRIADPVLTGFEVRGTRDVTQVRVVEGIPQRVVTRELRLLALSAGVATIGPVRVTQGTRAAETVPITVRLSAPTAVSAAALASRVRAVLDTLQPPTRGSDVAVEVLVLPETVVLGRQLDLVTLAWFPRDIRTQLRTPPTLAPPDVQGVWTYQQATMPGVAASRQAAGRWYDLYVSHQVAFPLAAGEVSVGRATVTYVQPLSYSFLSRELQHEVQSESVAVTVLPQPSAGRPTGFSGAAGRGLTIELTASDTTLRPGGATTVQVAVSGEGNVALWPEPHVEWPAGVRVYPGDPLADVTSRDGLVGGTKRFTYLLVADSAGTHPVPGVVYPFFDTGTRRYVVASTAGLQLVAPPGTVVAVPRPLPPGLLTRTRGGVGAVAHRLAGWVWVLVFALPPLVMGGMWLGRRLRGLRLVRRPGRAGGGGALVQLDRELRDALARLVGSASHAEGPALTAALRAAGVDAQLAQHVLRVRERLRHAVFGPEGASDAEELTAEVHEVLRALAGEAPGTERRQLVPLALWLVVILPAALAAQGPRPEQLYEAGAFRAAADSFAARTAREPRVAAYWYNLGATYYRLGDDGRARAAWVRAARLAPRHTVIRRALRLAPADPVSARLAPVWWVTSEEALLGAALCWLLGWAVLGARRLRRVAVVLLVVAVGSGVVAWRTAVAYRAPVAIVLTDGIPLRVAPYGSASAPRRLFVGSAVRVREARGDWLLVERGNDRGWVLAGEVARL